MYLLGCRVGEGCATAGVTGGSEVFTGQVPANELGLMRQRKWARAAECAKKGERKAGLQRQGKREAGLGCQVDGFRERKLRRPGFQQLRLGEGAARLLPSCLGHSPLPPNCGLRKDRGSQGSEEGLFIPRARMRYGLQGRQQYRCDLGQSW